MKLALNALQVRAAKSGVGQYIHALTEAILPLSAGHDITLYATEQNAANYQFGAPNYRVKTWGLPQRLRSLRLVNELLRLPAEIAREKYDVWHGPSNFLPVRRVRGTRYVVTVHDLSYYVHPWRCPPVRRAYWYAMTARTLEVADLVITISENSRRDIERFFPKLRAPIRVIAEAAHDRFSPAEGGLARPGVVSVGQTRPFVLYVGTLEPGKNVARIVEAFDQIASRFPDHDLLLVGDRGWLFEGILKSIEGARHVSRIRQLGHLADEVVVDLLRACDAFVFPSMYEGFGLPPLEAMACGASVITSSTSSIPEVVGDAALTVNPESTAEIAEAMQRVLSEPGVAAELRRKGLARAAKFSWAETARQTLDAYESV